MAKSLNLVSDQTALSNAFTDEKPTGNLSNNNSVNGSFSYGSGGPLKGQCALNKAGGTSDNLSKLSRGGRSQLDLSIFDKGFETGLRKSQERSGGFGNEIQHFFL
eukprot:TRINITY_DN13541_c0_g2_i1.p2 TRINITY_DN13541_c0_g2~~TRINITY_DN13541_c0_g2_i1.p2  ORF type:complete len:105 (-),score=17.22 TRINITY_DN13541_c0_g2_i1:25-339(-)